MSNTDESKAKPSEAPMPADRILSTIPQADLDRYRRKMCRRIASALVRAMAETDTDFATIAARTARSETNLRSFIRALIDGRSPRDGLELMAVFAHAMDCEVEFHLVKREKQPTADLPENTDAG